MRSWRRACRRSRDDWGAGSAARRWIVDLGNRTELSDRVGRIDFAAVDSRCREIGAASVGDEVGVEVQVGYVCMLAEIVGAVNTASVVAAELKTHVLASRVVAPSVGSDGIVAAAAFRVSDGCFVLLSGAPDELRKQPDGSGTLSLASSHEARTHGTGNCWYAKQDQRLT